MRFKLPLRQTWMVASLLKLANLDLTVPDYTTMRRCQKTLAVHTPYWRADGPLNLLVPSHGLRANRCRGTDGAYDTRRYHTAIIDRQATAIIPIRKNGRPSKEDCLTAITRNETGVPSRMIT